MNFHKHTLANGLTIIGEHNPSAVSAAIGFFVRTGARDEYAGVEGVSHFLEHMLFKGTETRSALDLTYQLGAIGAQANAFTSEENTVYYMAVLPEYLKQAIELLSDMMRSVLDEGEFNVEKKVILEEIALYQDRPSFLLFETAMQEFFKGHTAGNSVLGTVDSITALSRAQMYEYFLARYVPENMVFAISGAFDWEETLATIEQYCAGWERGGAQRQYLAHSPIVTERTLRKADLQRAHICLVAPGPSAQDEARYSAQLLSCIMGDSTGSRMYWELVDKGLADSASIDVEEMDQLGMLYAYASCSPENVELVEKIVMEILNTPDAFDTAMFERAKTKLASRLVLQGESSMRRLMSTGLHWVYRAEYASLHDELASLQSLAKSDLEDLLGRFDCKPTAVVRMLPEEQAHGS